MSLFRRAAFLWTLAGTGTLISCESSGPSDEQPEFTQVIAGSGSTCALTPQGAAYCWGRLFAPEPGPSTPPDTLASSLRFQDLSLAANIFGAAICGVTTELQAYCWGTLLIGYDGGLVLGNVPQRIGAGLSFATMRLASRHFCGLTPAGAAYCGGDYRGGVRGTGQAVAEFAAPDLSPNPVAGGLTFTDLAVGLGTSCGLDPSGAAHCWGSEVALGNPEAVLTALEECGYTVPPFFGRCSHIPVPVAGGHSFTHLAAGQTHVCGITAQSEVFCWGGNEAGQLGGGDTLYAAVPVRAQLPEAALAITAGSGFTCAIVATRQAYCWGNSHVGQTGSGRTEAAVLLPNPVAGGFHYRAISAGESHVCALRVSGEVYCWGSNFTGELGTGDIAQSVVPRRVQF